MHSWVVAGLGRAGVAVHMGCELAGREGLRIEHAAFVEGHAGYEAYEFADSEAEGQGNGSEEFAVELVGNSPVRVRQLARQGWWSVRKIQNSAEYWYQDVQMAVEEVLSRGYHQVVP